MNKTPSFQAWLTGFRKGVEHCLDNNKKLSIEEFKTRLTIGQLDDLTIWHNVGSDEVYGKWLIAGARQGTYMTMLTNWDYSQLGNEDALTELWDTVSSTEPDVVINRVAEDLHQELNLPMCMLAPEESVFFKYHLNKATDLKIQNLDLLEKF